MIYASDFGWVPGVLDMAAAQAAIDAAVASGEPLVLENGTYLVDVVPDTGVMLVVEGDGTGSLTILGSGSTRLEVLTEDARPQMLMVKNIEYFELRGLEIFGNKTMVTNGPGATVSSIGVGETHYYDLHVEHAGPLVTVGTPGLRAGTFYFGDIYLDSIKGAGGIMTKKFGVENIIQTGPVTVVNGAGGFTFDSDPAYFATRPDLISITNEAGSNQLVFTYSEPHGREVGDWIESRGADQRVYNGRFQVESVTEFTITVTQVLTPTTTEATGDFDATYVWGPIENVTIDSLHTTAMRNVPIEGVDGIWGQVRTVKLEDGIGHATIRELVGVDHYGSSRSGTDRSSVLHMSAGGADRPIGSLDAQYVSGTSMESVVTMLMGRDDWGRISIETLEGQDVATVVNIWPIFDYSAYAQGHGTVSVLHIGNLVMNEGVGVGIYIGDDPDKPIVGPIIDVLIIDEITNPFGAPVLDFAAGSIGTIIGGDQDNDFTGTSAGETLMGMGGDDVLIGRSGDDVLIGGVGSDMLDGGKGADKLKGESGHDVLNGAAGADLLIGSGGRDTLYGGSGYDELNGGQANDLLFGGLGNDLLIGGDGLDYLEGGDGKDILRGNTGADEIFGGSGWDAIDGGAGGDFLSGGWGNDSIFGKSQDDDIFGDQGDDYLDGGTGDDVLNGGAGSDTLIGGAGADVFVFDSTDGAVDEIVDLEAGDLIDLSFYGIGYDDLVFEGDTITTADGLFVITVSMMPTADMFIF